MPKRNLNYAKKFIFEILNFHIKLDMYKFHNPFSYNFIFFEVIPGNYFDSYFLN